VLCSELIAWLLADDGYGRNGVPAVLGLDTRYLDWAGLYGMGGAASWFIRIQVAALCSPPSH
jgi:hypothetical protein